MVSETPPARLLPALTESSRLRYVVLTALYAAQGVPYGLLFVAVPAYLAQREVAPAAVAGVLALTGLPASLKLFYGPIMDRWSFLPMGRRRPWVLVGQTGLVGAFLALSLLPEPTEALFALSMLGFATYFFTMFQDVATDGMAVDVVPVDEQPRANGFMWGGVSIGSAGSAAGGAWVMSTFGFGPAMLCGAGAVTLIALFPLLFRERPGERFLPWTSGRPSATAVQRQLGGWADIGRSLWRVFLLPASLIGGTTFFVYGLTRGMHTAVLPLLGVQELGWADTAYSNLYATGSLIAGVLGMAVGGWLAARVGRIRFLTLGLLLFLAVEAVFVFSPGLWPFEAFYGSYVSLVVLFDVFLMIAFLSVAMALCGVRVAATQFAVYMAFGNFGLSGGSALVGPLHAAFDYAGVLFALVGLLALALLLVRLLDLDTHRTRLGDVDAEPDLTASEAEPSPA